MSFTKIDDYFANLGIKVIYNCLGHNLDLVYSFVNENNHKLKSYITKSHHVKYDLYRNIYNIKHRHKKTGFELLEKLDRQFRDKVGLLIKKSQMSPLKVIRKDELQDFTNYKQKLNDFTNKIENPLLYYSGGMDSELVAMSFIAMNKSFKTVIFEWTDNSNKIINNDDLTHAFAFCRNNNIVPIIKKINIESLWQTKFFEKFAIDLQIVSPQLVTHAYCIMLMSEEYKNYTHVFGGEVRFQNYMTDDGEVANLAFLDKLVPAYNGQTYTDIISDYTPQSAGVSLYYQVDAAYPVYTVGNYVILGQHGGQLATGPWTDTIASSYEFQIQYWNLLGSVGYYDVNPPAAPTSYTPLVEGLYGLNLICELTARPPDIYSSYNFARVYFEINLRVVGETDPVMFSTVTFEAAASQI